MAKKEIDEVLEDRSEYGPFERNCQRIVRAFNAITGIDSVPRPLEPRDYPGFMIIVKLVREYEQHKDDNLLDIEGYAKLWAEMVKEK